MHFLLEDWLAEHKPIFDKMYYRHKRPPITSDEVAMNLKKYKVQVLKKCRSKSELTRAELFLVARLRGRVAAMKSLMQLGFPKPRQDTPSNHSKMSYSFYQNAESADVIAQASAIAGVDLTSTLAPR